MTNETTQARPPEYGAATGSAPKMTFVEGPSGYALFGWNELNEWAVRNDLTWARCGLETMAKGLQHEDALRLLCAALLLEKHGQLWPNAPDQAPRKPSPEAGCSDLDEEHVSCTKCGSPAVVFSPRLGHRCAAHDDGPST